MVILTEDMFYAQVRISANVLRYRKEVSEHIRNYILL